MHRFWKRETRQIRRSEWTGRDLVRFLFFVVLLTAGLVAALPASLRAESLNMALANAYQCNPRVDAERARLRATDEEVARAHSGYRPIITGNADFNYQVQRTRPGGTEESKPRGYSIDAVQPVFSGFRTFYGVKQSEAEVRAGRETLRSVEQEVLLQAVTAYMDVVRDQAILRLRESDVRFLTEELKATRDRFSVGEVTKTDTAQAEARRSAAVSALELARANLQTSRAVYERVTCQPPGSVSDPGVRAKGLPGSIAEAINISVQESPVVVAALYREESARHAVDLIRGELLPTVQLEASYSDRFPGGSSNGGLGGGLSEIETTTLTGRVNVPIYEGGEVYARVRQAKHLHVSRLQEIEQARTEVQESVVTAWSQYVAARAQLTSDQAQVSANQTALSGVREEERVGQRTLLDVLDAQRELLNSQVQVVTTHRNLVVSAYSVLSTVGRLNVLGLGVSDPVYDPEEHYLEVRRKWWGLSITHEDGRREYLDLWNSRVEPVK